MASYLSFAERFWSKVDIAADTACWNWLGARNNVGYGLMSKTKNGQTKESLAHRIAWVLCFGKIYGDLEVGHKCAKRLCVNPSHLYLSTRAENLKEIRERGKYKFISQIDSETLLKAMIYARSINALWKIRQADLNKLPRDKIIEIHNLVFNEHQDQASLIADYKKPNLEIMPCGHNAKYIVQADEGTAWCLMCEYNTTNGILEKVKTLVRP